MEKSDIIKEIEAECSNKIKVKGSLFIGHAYKLSSVKEAEDLLGEIRKEYYDGTHHCYAYKINNGKEKFSDDGEPNGTAGMRIISAINSYSLTNILVVVIRYFGGTKLGIGPLGKAYRETALGLLESAKIIKLYQYEEIRINYNYDHTNSIHFLLNKYKCRQIKSSYVKNPIIEALIRPRDIDNLRNELKEKTSGNAKITFLDKKVYLRFK